MRKLAWVMIVVSAVSLVLATIFAILGKEVIGVPPEGFSRGCTNLTLLAIALLLASK